MARTIKTGLDYFPLDVNFLQDRKIRRIIRKHGVASGIAIIALFSLIYRERGYYLPWNEDYCFDLSEMSDMDMDKMHAIVSDAIRADLFDEEQFRKNGILTSKAIQKQYIACTQKRKLVIIEDAYALIDNCSAEEKEDCVMEEENKCSANDSSAVIYPFQSDNPVEETLFSEPEMQQRKEKEIESRENRKKTSPLPPPKTEGEVPDGGPEEWRKKINDEKVPHYCLNKQTHNYDGLLYRLRQIHVTEQREIDAILKLSNYGRIGHPLWGIISYNNWPKGKSIKFPGKFILSQLKSK